MILNVQCLLFPDRRNESTTEKAIALIIVTILLLLNRYVIRLVPLGFKSILLDLI